MNRNRVLLAFPPCPRMVTAGWPPLGIAYIAAYCLHKDPSLTVKAVDFTVEKFTTERWKQELAHFQPDAVGISTQSVNHQAGLLLARLTKEFDPNLLTVMGGVHPSAYPEECLKYADIVVRGEGEETFYELVQGREWPAILGISYLKDGQAIHNPPRGRIKDLDSLPMPAYDLFPMDKYFSIQGRGGVVVGYRGCPYSCTFCASPVAWERRIMFRSPEKVVDEVEYLHQRYGYTRVNFSDDAINIPLKRALKMCDEIIKRGLHQKMYFVAFVKANRSLVSRELFQRMKEANFRAVSLGIESGSPKVLKAIRKNTRLDEYSRAISLAREAGIKNIVGNFMVGNWDETVWDVFQTWWFVLRHDVDPIFRICTPFPGTEFNRQLREAGYLSGEPNWSKSDRYTALAATNKMPRVAITILHLLSGFLQILLWLFRSREKNLAWLQIGIGSRWLMDKVFARGHAKTIAGGQSVGKEAE